MCFCYVEDEESKKKEKEERDYKKEKKKRANHQRCLLGKPANTTAAQQRRLFFQRNAARKSTHPTRQCATPRVITKHAASHALNALRTSSLHAPRNRHTQSPHTRTQWHVLITTINLEP